MKGEEEDGRRKGKRTSNAPTDQDMVALRLGHAGRHHPDSDLTHKLDRDTSARVGALWWAIEGMVKGRKGERVEGGRERRREVGSLRGVGRGRE
jgi:hypothetical protein